MFCSSRAGIVARGPSKITLDQNQNLLIGRLFKCYLLSGESGNGGHGDAGRGVMPNLTSIAEEWRRWWNNALIALTLRGVLRDFWRNPNEALDHIIPHINNTWNAPRLVLSHDIIHVEYRHRIGGRGTVHTLAWWWDSRNSTRANWVQHPVVTPSIFPNLFWYFWTWTVYNVKKPWSLLGVMKFKWKPWFDWQHHYTHKEHSDVIFGSTLCNVNL